MEGLERKDTGKDCGTPFLLVGLISDQGPLQGETQLSLHAPSGHKLTNMFVDE